MTNQDIWAAQEEVEARAMGTGRKGETEEPEIKSWFSGERTGGQAWDYLPTGLQACAMPCHACD